MGIMVYSLLWSCSRILDHQTEGSRVEESRVKMGFRVEGLGLGFRGLGFSAWGLGFGVLGFGF